MESTRKKWLAAATAAGAAVFLVTVFGERAPGPPEATSAQAVLTSGDSAADGDPSQQASSSDAGVIDALQNLLDELGIDAAELADEDRGGNKAADADVDTVEPAKSGRITIENFSFGLELKVVPGAEVEVVNRDSATHNVTAVNNSFKTPNLASGESATLVAPDEPGRYEFTCTLHPEMTGTLVVEEPSGRQSRSSQGGTQNSSASSDRSNNTSTGSSSPSSSSGSTQGDNRGNAGAASATNGYGDGY